MNAVAVRSGWLLSLRRCPRPSAPTDPWLSGRFAALEALWGKVLDDRSPADPAADVENWVEQAARLQAAVSGFGRDLWVTTDHRAARHLDTGETVDIGEVGALPRYGSQPNDVLRTLPMERAADGYFHLASFVRNARRSVALCSHGEGTADDLIETVWQMRRRGHMRVVIKVTRAKYGLFFVDLTDVATREAAAEAVERELDWSLVHLDGVTDAFSVQEHVAFAGEYRVFVVGHVPVTGAGCIEDRTPLFNADAFDPVIEDARGRTVRRADPAAVATLVGFARQVADQVRQEAPQLRDYVVDVAFTPRGPAVIEFNGLLNSGLYASDPHRVTAALGGVPFPQQEGTTPTWQR